MVQRKELFFYQFYKNRYGSFRHYISIIRVNAFKFTSIQVLRLKYTTKKLKVGNLNQSNTESLRKKTRNFVGSTLISLCMQKIQARYSVLYTLGGLEEAQYAHKLVIKQHVSRFVLKFPVDRHPFCLNQCHGGDFGLGA